MFQNGLHGLLLKPERPRNILRKDSEAVEKADRRRLAVASKSQVILQAEQGEKSGPTVTVYRNHCRHGV